MPFMLFLPPASTQGPLQIVVKSGIFQTSGGITKENHEPGVSRFSQFARAAEMGPFSWRVNTFPLGGRKITVSGAASDGLLFGRAPDASYSLSILETAQGGAMVVGGSATPFPSIEVWQYGGPGGPKLIYKYDAKAAKTGVADLYKDSAPMRVLLIAVALIGSLVMLAAVLTLARRPIRFDMPAGYRGWVLIEYTNPACPPVATDALYIVIVIGASGRGCTASSMPAGWRYTRYDSVAANGTRLTVVSSNWEANREIWAESWVPAQETVRFPRRVFFVGSKADLERSWSSRP